MAASTTDRELTVTPEDAGERVDRWVAAQVDGLSRSRVQKLLEQGHIQVDGQDVAPRHLLRAGEVVRVHLPAPEPVAIEPDASVDFTIVHEDDDLAVVDKPVGLVVHPAPGHREGTLVHGLLARLASLSAVGGRARPGLVHRLDRDTSGLLVVAKNDVAHQSLQNQLRRRSLRRIYRALCWGTPQPEAGSIELPLDRDPRDRKRRAVVEGGRPALTLYQIEERGEGAALLRLELKTGRTHQIRVHLAAVGHPVLGDALYGGDQRRLKGAAPEHRAGLASALRILHGQALHASELVLSHPRSGEPMHFRSEMPPELRRAWMQLRPPLAE